jgi:endonuclease/exonuclease/phosphatase family metal-dependent hydrolase
VHPARSFLTLVKIVLLIPAYAIGVALAAIGKRPLLLAVGLAVSGAVIAASVVPGCGHVRIGTFNIRQFGGARDTDMAKLTKLVASLDADILAVQEIKNEAKLRELAAALSSGSRVYKVALSRCGGRSEMRVGFIYDQRRVTLASTKEYPELAPGDDGRCSAVERPGFLGVFNDGARSLHLLAVHFQPGSDRGDYAKRTVQWTRAHKIAAQLREGGVTAVAILGDANSTGYRDDDNGERTFVNASAKGARMSVVTAGIACSEYWKSDGVYVPSLLDHAVATDGLVRSGSARVHGYCETLRCETHRSPTPPDEFTSISDHCPVTFDVLGR